MRILDATLAVLAEHDVEPLFCGGQIPPHLLLHRSHQALVRALLLVAALQAREVGLEDLVDERAHLFVVSRFHLARRHGFSHDAVAAQRRRTQAEQ